MKSHPRNIDLDFIGGWYIDRSICDRMIADYQTKQDHEPPGQSIRGYRYCNSFDMDVELMTEYEQALNTVIAEYKKIYPYSTESLASWSLSGPYNVQKYEPGRHYSAWHCENNGNSQYFRRHLAFMTYLNDVTDGGETVFLHQNKKIRPEKGLTLIWPAHFTHIHRGNPSPTQIKYITTGWFEFFNTESFLSEQLATADADFWQELDKLVKKLN